MSNNNYKFEGGAPPFALPPKYRSRHVPKLSLLPFEIDAPSSQLTPPMLSQEIQYGEHFTPQGKPAIIDSGFMMDGYFGSNQPSKSQESRQIANHQRKRSSSKKFTPNSHHLPEFVPHHSRGTSSTSTWAKSSTSSDMLDVADSRTVLIYPPRKASQVTTGNGPGPEYQGDPELWRKSTDNRGRNYSIPRLAPEDHPGNKASPMWSSRDDILLSGDRSGIWRHDSLATLVPSPLDISRKQSHGSLKTPLPIPSKNLGIPKTLSPAHLPRKASCLSVHFDVPRKDSSTLPWSIQTQGVEPMTPEMVSQLSSAIDRYKSQLFSNPFNPTLTSPIYEDEKFPNSEDDKFHLESWPLPLPAGRKSKVDRHSFLKLSLGALDMTDAVSIYTARKDPKLYSYFITEPSSKHRKVRRPTATCWGRWSTRQIILASIGIILLVLLSGGVAGAIILTRKHYHGPGLTPTWRPAIGNTWQIQNGALQVGAVAGLPTLRAQVYTLDLFANNASTIAALHHMGRRVICSFSAGTWQAWAPDASKFPNGTVGASFRGATNESWVDTASTPLRNVMAARIKMASNYGCDGVDPLNVDGYKMSGMNATGFAITEVTAADYVNYLSNVAHHLDIAIGLRNSPELIENTLKGLDWQLNDGCAGTGDCVKYQPFIEAGKPVFHMEFAVNASEGALETYCNAVGTQHFSTLLKKATLDTWAAECPYGDPAFGAD